VTTDPVAARAQTLSQVLAAADGTDPAGWTKRSHRAFTAELARIGAAGEQPGADEDVLIDAVYAAYELLVSTDTLLRKFPVTREMVAASTVEWPGTGTEESNGWRAFDGSTGTYTDTLAAESWIGIDAGDAGPVTIDTLRVHPRAGQANRARGTVLQGSDDGTAWTDLHTIGEVTEGQWYEAKLDRRASYRRVRMYDGHDGRCNLAEVEFWYHLPDEA
jgi:hypothetical protein